jgi:hypothetical protein
MLALGCASEQKDANSPDGEESKAESGETSEPSTVEKINDDVNQAHGEFKENIKPVVAPIDEGVKEAVSNAKETVGGGADQTKSAPKQGENAQPKSSAPEKSTKGEPEGDAPKSDSSDSADE